MKKKNIKKFILVVSIFLLFVVYSPKTQVLAQTSNNIMVMGQCEFWSSYGGRPIISDASFTATGFSIYQERNGEKCYAPLSCVQANRPIVITVEGLNFIDSVTNPYNVIPDQVTMTLQRLKNNGAVGKAWPITTNITNNKATVSQVFDKEAMHRAVVYYSETFPGSGSLTCSIKFSVAFAVSNVCDPTSCSTDPADPTEDDGSYKLCLAQITINQPEALKKCIDCFEKNGVWTAVGCIPQTTEGIISTIMEIGVIIAGTIVLIMILTGAFMLSTSQGDPKKTQEAKELITSAIIGLLFIIFSVTILEFIGVSIIKIPGFGEL